MTEAEYVRITNLTKLRIARDVFGACLWLEGTPEREKLRQVVNLVLELEEHEEKASPT
jgi:hypothetical protein